MNPTACVYFDRTRFASFEDVRTNLARHLRLDDLESDLARFGVSPADYLGLATAVRTGRRPSWLRGVVKGGR
jgi:hypothetical protein